MIRITAAVLVLAAGALVPIAGAKPAYTATCTANTHDLTVTWTGGTDLTATTAVLEWADLSDQRVSLELPKQGGLRTYTWNNLGSNSGPLVAVAVTFYRNNLSSESLTVTCSP